MENFVILQSINKTDWLVLSNHVFYSHAIKHNIVQFHSSLIQWQEKGIMFLGPSGIGKTTQAELWERYQDAEIINGDLVFVQETDHDFLGWGTPWHGSSPYCLNKSVHVAALVVLKQGKENRIRKLQGFEMASEVGKHLFYPNWVENGMTLALDILNHLLSQVPVYELTNKADEESVELVKQVVIQNE